jgi:hypothetical protein
MVSDASILQLLLLLLSSQSQGAWQMGSLQPKRFNGDVF